MVDERLTTNLASANLRAAGHKTKDSRDFIDQASAVILLEEALSIEKRTGELAGKSLEEVRDEL